VVVTGMEAGGMVKELQAALFPVCAKGQIKVQLKLCIGLVMLLYELDLPFFKQSRNICSLVKTVEFSCLHCIK
jgi:hypothetical protein